VEFEPANSREPAGVVAIFVWRFVTIEFDQYPPKSVEARKQAGFDLTLLVANAPQAGAHARYRLVAQKSRFGRFHGLFRRSRYSRHVKQDILGRL
jgi:hypothetical protein